MKKALIFYGGWEGHHPSEVSQLFADMLISEDFEVTRTDNMDILDDAAELKKLNVIIPVWTMGEISKQRVKNICDAVESGVGLCGCHGGMCDAFRSNTTWQFLTGSQWVAHPGNDGVEYEVKLDKESYFTRGLEDFSLVSEQYYMHVDPSVKVYAVTEFPVFDGPHSANGKTVMPVVYTKMWGKGRIFYTSLGHTEKVFEIQQAKEIMRRGLIWASDRSVEE